jgi:hypothetical protein
MYIVYLRRVHFYDYYFYSEHDFFESLNRKCGVSFRETIKGENSTDWLAKFFDRLDTKIQMRIDKTISSEDIVKLGVCAFFLIVRAKTSRSKLKSSSKNMSSLSQIPNFDVRSAPSYSRDLISSVNIS